MTTDPPAEPSLPALSESLAALAALNQRLDQAGLHAGLNLAARFEELAGTVADALDAAAPHEPAAPYWIGMDRDSHHARLADLQRWADTVLRPHYGGYQLAECWPRHINAVWNCPPWPPNGTAPTPGHGPTWPGPWSSTTGGYPAPCAASPTSPAGACRTAPRSAALTTGLLVPDTASPASQHVPQPSRPGRPDHRMLG